METPDWCARLVAATPRPATPERLMQLAVDVATGSARHGGGPFGTVIADRAGHVVSVGWNRVVESHDSTAHAEIVAIRRAQRTLATHDLRAGGELDLYTSCAPCIMCFGAIYWSGVRHVRAAATRADAESLGFQEGPVDAALWASAARDKGIAYTPGFCRDDAALAPFREYQARGGRVY